MSPRYIVSGPVPSGDQWYRIADTQSPHYPNFAVAQFSPDLDFAQREADELCRRLNKGEAVVNPSVLSAMAALTLALETGPDAVEPSLISPGSRVGPAFDAAQALRDNLIRRSIAAHALMDALE